MRRENRNPAPIPTCVAPSARPAGLTPRQVEREFRRRLAAGAQLRAAGAARKDPLCLLSAGYTPKHKVVLFDTTYYLTNARKNDDIRFFVGYVAGERDRAIYPRIFYKDMSLIWRSASHYIRSNDENWIGKGDVRIFVANGEEFLSSAESTTDLPLEVQTAFETLSRRARRVPHDDAAIELILRRAPVNRLAAYRDFTEPRTLAQADPRNLINRGRRIAWFARNSDPSSLRFAAGFEPDFESGVLEVHTTRSRFYGGRLRRLRIFSSNRRVQYLFMEAPRHVWIIPPQATTTEISSYGVRTVDVLIDENLCVPGYEYHLENGGEQAFLAQIPEGFVGPLHERDSSRADASEWLERLPVIREFRSRLGSGATRRPRRSSPGPAAGSA